MERRYFTAQESEQFVFYRVPKVLITADRYKNITAEAKLLYGLLLDRMGLSMKNGWTDENGFVYIYYTVAAVRKDLSCGKEKACKLLAELESTELLERRRQGQGKPDRLYVLPFISEVGKTDFRSLENRTSKSLQNSPQEFRKSGPNKTDKNYIKMNNIHPSVCADGLEDEIREQLEYNIFVERYPEKKSRLDEVVSLICDTLCSTAPTIRIGCADLPKKRVDERLRQLTFEHVEYVFSRMDELSNGICNIRAYMLTALHNAPATMDSYYTAMVRHDLNDGNWASASSA